ncbi:MAG: hypothetical protein AAGF55_17275 [Pseudomonadota bacterium]
MEFDDKSRDDEFAEHSMIQGKKRRALGRIVDEDAPIFRSVRIRSRPRPASRELGLDDEKFR